MGKLPVLCRGRGTPFLRLETRLWTTTTISRKITGPILGTLSLLALGFFCYIVFYMTRQLPASAGAPHVGQKAPEFVLPDTTNQPVSLASLLSTPLVGSQVPPKGVVLVFYRGYW